MKENIDLLGWLLGILGSLSLLNWLASKKSDNEKFKSLFDFQRAAEVRVGKLETEIESIHAHHLKTLDEIKKQNTEIAKDVRKIEIALASLPKRKKDE